MSEKTGGVVVNVGLRGYQEALRSRIFDCVSENGGRVVVVKPPKMVEVGQVEQVLSGMFPVSTVRKVMAEIEKRVVR